MHLTVVHDFTSNVHDCAVAYKRGDKIFDPDLMKAVLEGDNRLHVVRTSEPQE